MSLGFFLFVMGVSMILMPILAAMRNFGWEDDDMIRWLTSLTPEQIFLVHGALVGGVTFGTLGILMMVWA